jgi:chromosome transmission fidelity protein 1
MIVCFHTKLDRLYHLVVALACCAFLFCVYRWLRENPVFVAPAAKLDAGQEEDLPSWVIEHVSKRAEECRRAAEQKEKERLQRVRQRMADAGKERKAKMARAANVFVIGGRGPSTKDDKKPQLPALPWETKSDKDDAFLLSDNDEEGGKQPTMKDAMRELWDMDSDDEDGKRQDDDEMDVRKVIYCSRTHSQLSQFMGEIRRTEWGKDLKAVVLASRKSMCIHEKVSSLKSSTRVNAACLDLQRGKGDTESRGDEASSRKQTKKKSSCPFLADEMKLLDLRDIVLAEVQDIEDIVSHGRAHSACPYYASRSAVKSAELVALPYTSLVHKGTREALGVSLDGNVVIIDEAHNLIDAVNEVHSAVLHHSAISALRKLFQMYMFKYQLRLSRQSVKCIQQVELVLKSFEEFMQKTQKKPSTRTAGDAATQCQKKELGKLLPPACSPCKNARMRHILKRLNMLFQSRSCSYKLHDLLIFNHLILNVCDD